MHEWSPWRPDGYPIVDPMHNPWVPVDPISGSTAYQLWQRNPGISECEFRDLLDAMNPYRD